MASSINRQVAQVLLRRLKAKDTTHVQAVRLAELIARFQGVKGRQESEAPEPTPETLLTDTATDVLGGLK